MEPVRQMKKAKRGEVVPVGMPEIDKDPATAQSARISAVHKVKPAAVPQGQVAPVAKSPGTRTIHQSLPNVFNRSFLNREMPIN
jgi:hypothetical protein